MPRSFYTPLDVSKKQIRLVRLIPNSNDSHPVKCTVEMASLLEDQPYHALSYTWGSSLPPTTIIANGIEVPAGGNLAAALRHFLTTGDAITTPIWIDALCINQSDIPERNVQVAMMGEIYQRASSVHVWLGGPELVAREQMLAFRRYASCIEHGKPSTWHIDSDDDESLTQLRHLQDLMHNPYWKRTWILQETCFALDAVVHGGGERVYIKDFGTKKAFESLRSQPRIQASEPIVLVEETSHAIKTTLEPMAMTAWFSRVVPLIDQGEKSWLRVMPSLFLCLRRSLATDPRDKIYGMLGLLPRAFTGTVPDYTKSVAEVYRDATVQLMEISNDIVVLHQACSGNEELATWVPDFNVPPSLTHWMTIRISGGMPSDKAIAVHELQSDGLLKVAGRLIDSVVAINPGRDPSVSPSTENVRDQITKWIALFNLVASPSLPKDLTQLKKRHIFWRSACAGELDNVRHRKHSISFYGASTAEQIDEIIHRLDSFLEGNNDDRALIDNLQRTTSENDFFITKAGYAGLAPRGRASVGNDILILAGANYLFCAEKVTSNSGKTFALKSSCFVESHVTDYPVDSRTQGIIDGGALVAEARDRGFGEDVDKLFEDVLLV